MSRFVRSFKSRKIFLDQLTVGNSLSFAANAAGASLSQFRRWRESDENFAKDWDEAINEGTDFIEDVALDRALKKSDALMQMILKARRPDKYDRGSKLELSGGISVEGAKGKLLNKLARLQAQGAISSGSLEEVEEVSADQGSKEVAPKLLPAPDHGDVGRGRKRRAAASGGRRAQAS
jgi:hypothetical protein